MITYMQLRAALPLKEVDLWARAYYRTGQLDPLDWPLVMMTPMFPIGQRSIFDFIGMQPISAEYVEMVNTQLLARLSDEDLMQFYCTRFVTQAIVVRHPNVARIFRGHYIPAWARVANISWAQVLALTPRFNALAYCSFRYKMLEHASYNRTPEGIAEKNLQLVNALDTFLSTDTATPEQYRLYLRSLIATFRTTGVPTITWEQSVQPILAPVVRVPTLETWTLDINSMSMLGLGNLVGEYTQELPTDAEIMHRLSLL